MSTVYVLIAVDLLFFRLNLFMVSCQQKHFFLQSVDLKGIHRINKVALFRTFSKAQELTPKANATSNFTWKAGGMEE
jgi:hypothetical protein